MLQIHTGFTLIVYMIRGLKWEDMDDIIRNYYSYYDEMESENQDLGLVFYWIKPDYPSEIQWFSTLYTDVLNGKAKCLVAEEDGHVVGLCDVHSKRPDSEVAHLGILGIAILKEYRDKGIGRSLLEGMIRECRGSFEIITLEVFSINSKAYELYKKVGFKENGRLEKGLKRNGRYYEELEMYLDLTEH